MATDYDAPRKNNDDEEGNESLEELQQHRATSTGSSRVDEDENETAESFELPGADLSGEELMVRVLPAQLDEFTCTSCFLVVHRSQLHATSSGPLICGDCAA
ncbi:DUF4193 domain-containing protein [Kineococcus sp. NBC_00420]|uniref:DUF4193 domain-containing protein n=1 Tax=Kineococcus sp. NBC_00420 TaxID=2903564 RepID=UPI002E218ABA